MTTKSVQSAQLSALVGLQSAAMWAGMACLIATCVAWVCTPIDAVAQPAARGDFSPFARQYCDIAVKEGLIPQAIREWATSEKEEFGLGENYQVTAHRVKSFVPWEEVICSISVKYDKPYRGRVIKLEVVNMDFRIWGNDDGSKTWVETYKWPSANELKDTGNAFNRSLVMDGETFEQAWARDRASRPKNILEAFGRAQAAQNEAVRTQLRDAGVDVDAIEAADREETRKHGPACRASGGTWGYPMHNGVRNGSLGCYFQTVNK